jgi:phage-related minor tail protein
MTVPGARMIDRSPNGYANADPAGGPSEVEQAARRLTAALDALEAAVERRSEADRDEDELAARIQALGTDRSRLANELDGSLVRSRELERVNREVSQRLGVAIETIRAVLDNGEAT